jgi:arylsulfatase A-like enzyme
MKRGFDEFFGFVGGKHRYAEDSRKDPNGPLLRGMEEVSEKEYLTEAFTREAISFIERNKARPFFLHLAPNAVHVPLQAPPEKYLGRVKNAADEQRRNLVGILAALDDQMGAVRAKLKELGLAEKTLVVFISDNGGAVGNNSKNGKLRGVKTDLFDGGIRVPLLIGMPGVLHHTVEERLASILDLYPTILNAAGVNQIPARLDGVDLLSGRGRHEALFWRYGPEKAVRSGKWKMVQQADGSNQLFDLEADVGEANDLAAKEPGKVTELLELWKKWDEKNVEPGWEGYQKNE